MIYVQLNKEDFEYDIHSLVKAFFPSENVSVCAHNKKAEEPVLLRIDVNYLPDRIRLELKQPQEKKTEDADSKELEKKAGNADSEEAENQTGDADSKEPENQAGDADSEEAENQTGNADSKEPEKKAGDVDSIEPENSSDASEAVMCRAAGNGWDTICADSFQVDDTDRKQTKNLLKQHLYHLLSDYTGRTLPWGTLTGIRPTKIPMSMLEEGKTPEQIKDYMSKTYGTSNEKMDLSIEIAERELKLLRRLDYEKGYSLYIGIPFCPSTCLYCSFTSYPVSAWKERVDDYLDALEKEIAFTAGLFAGRHLNSIYIGGGTPTTLTPRQMERLLAGLARSFDYSHLLEYTVEAGRPDSIDREKLEVLRAHGISRISINPQTMKQETLDLIGRHHTVRQTADSFDLARSLGFDNINMDLIMGLPQETLDDVRNTMEQLQQLEPDSITVHSLAVKRAARLAMFKEDYAGLKMVNTQAHLDTAAAACSRMGMQPYYLYRQKNMAGNFENVGYAKEGRAGIYNILIMEEKQTIAALGAGSISKRVRSGERIRRCENVKDVASFIERIDEMIERKRKLFGD